MAVVPAKLKRLSRPRLGPRAPSMAFVSLLAFFASVQHLAHADEQPWPLLPVSAETAGPVFLSLSDGGVDSCTTDNVCQEICETDFMVYPLGEKCYQYCEEDMDYIWDVFDQYCGEGLDNKHKFCADLCYDGFYCGEHTCGPCEDKCVEVFGLVKQIFDYCADCDDVGGYDDHKPTTTTTTTTVDKCTGYGGDKCSDLECWCKDFCDIVKCPHCEELCHKNEDKVWPIFERYCECGFCYESAGEDAGLLQVRLLDAASDTGCGCRSEHQYCVDICKAVGYSGPGLHRCTEDCYSSNKLYDVLEGYCTECYDEPDYYSTTEPETTPEPTTPEPTTEEPTTPKPYPSTTEPKYETTEPPDYKTTMPPPYETTRKPYATTRKPYHPPPKKYHPKQDDYVPFYWKIKSEKAKWAAKKAIWEAKAKAEAYKWRHPEIFGGGAGGGNKYRPKTRPSYKTTRPPHYETTHPDYETTMPAYETTEPKYETTTAPPHPPKMARYKV